MQWNFTFQAFLAAIFVFAGSNLDQWGALSAQVVLALVGMAVAYLCLVGVKAAQDQSDRLKTHWANEFCKRTINHPGECDILQGPYPQPFSVARGSRRGRYTSRHVCHVLILMWGLLATITIMLSLMAAKPHVSIKLGCDVSTATASDAITLNCKPK